MWFAILTAVCFLASRIFDLNRRSVDWPEEAPPGDRTLVLTQPESSLSASRAVL